MFDVIPAQGWAVTIVFLLFVFGLGFEVRRRDRQEAERDDALFRSMFPDLSPHFHPRNVLAYIKARVGERAPPIWKNPPGFAGAATAETEVVAARERITLRPVIRERVILKDNTGAILAQFMLEPVPDAMVLRVGKGKFTVDRRYNEVKYWHPDRQFKWLPPNIWRFTTAIVQGTISSSEATSSLSSPGGSSRDGRAGAAPFAGAGGAFDGGGASHGWEGGGVGY
jgi:uncharacterized membrane protein YgcG